MAGWGFQVDSGSENWDFQCRRSSPQPACYVCDIEDGIPDIEDGISDIEDVIRDIEDFIRLSIQWYGLKRPAFCSSVAVKFYYL